MNRNSILFFLRFIMLQLFISNELQAQQWKYKSKIDSIIDSKHYNQQSPGISICIAREGQIVYERQIGMANIKKKIPISRSTRFNIGSISKQFTAACIYQLEADGKLNRNDSIQKYIPELPSFGYPITLNHLLSHTSGLPDHIEVLGIQNKFKASKLDFNAVISYYQKSPTLSFKPGERFSYCNTGYMLLALIVERSTGISFSEFAQKTFLIPIQMKSTIICKSENEGLPDNTKSYFTNSSHYKESKHPLDAAMGATGVYSTLEDCIKWNEFILNGMGTTSSRTINQIMQTSFTLNDGSSVNYGGGLILKPYKGHRNIEHSGGWNEFLTQFRILPDLGYSILIATNSNSISPFGICDEISDALLNTSQLELNHNVKNVCPIKLDAFSGTYMDANNVIRKINISQDSLIITNYSNSSKKIVTANYLSTNNKNEYLFLDEHDDTLQFKIDQTQNVTQLTWVGGHYFRFKRRYEKLSNIPSNEFSKYTGDYHSSDFKQTLRFKLHHLSLKMYPVFYKGYQLEFVGGNVFKVKNESIYIRFEKDRILLGNDWVSNIELKKK